MKPTKDNTFCWFPFSLLALKTWHYKYGIMNAAPCCNSIRPDMPDPLNNHIELISNPDTITAEEIFHGKTMNEIREYALTNRRHPSCATCWKMEENGNGDDVYSYRLDSMPPGLLKITDEDELDDLIENPKLSSIDFAFGENCNLRCRMCQPGLSNKLRLDYQYFADNNVDTSGIQGFDWQKRRDTIIKENSLTELSLEEQKRTDQELYIGGEYQVYNWKDGKQWENILDNIHNLKHIKATGGETLMSKPFIQFLDTAIETGASKNIMLEFHTNATKFSNENIEKLKKFDGLVLNCSIDGYGKNYEYIRYPMKFSVLEKSLRNILESVKDINYKRTPYGFIKNFSFNVVLSVLNAHYLEDLVEFHYSLHKEYGRKSNEFAVFFLDLLWPEEKYINVKFLPKHIKLDLIEKFKNIKENYSHNNDYYHTNMTSGISFLEANLDLEITEQHRLNMLKEIKVFDMSRNQCYNDYIHPDIIEFLETPIK